MSQDEEDYDVFVSYYEDTADDYAERIYRVLTDTGYKVFVAHLERPHRIGDFQEYVDKAISSSSTFIFINTIGALTRTEIIREFNESFPDGDLSTRDLWIFRHDREDVLYGSNYFKAQTKIDLSTQNQSPFTKIVDLAYSALSRCQRRRFEQSSVDEFVKKDEKLDEEQRKDYSKISTEKKFAQEFKKRGFDVEFQRELGNYLSADLILKKNNQWIICEFKENAEKVSNKIFSKVLKYKNEIEHIDNTIHSELWLIGKGIFPKTLKKEAQKLNVKIIDDSNIDEILENKTLYLTIQKPVFQYGESIPVRIKISKLIQSPLNLLVKNKHGKNIFKKSFHITSTDWIEYKIPVKGDDWKKLGEQYTVIAEYGEASSLETVWRSNFGATIELDQKVYTWTDKVFVTLIAPDFINSIYQTITIRTNEGELSNYKLKQTRVDSGIFVGEFCLSGLPKIFKHVKQYPKNFLGIKKGNGPSDGFIPCGRSDGVQISFNLNEHEQVIANALVRWNIGEIQWLDSTYPVNGKGKIRVIDPDMNLNSNEIDHVEVQVWSDSDVIKKSVILHETNSNSGIFEGEINLNSRKSDKTTLLVSEGDTMTAEYVDHTLPEPYGGEDELSISSTSMIGTVVPPLQRIFVSDFQLTDQNENPVLRFIAKTPFFINATLENKQSKKQPFAFLIQLEDENNETAFFESKHGELPSNSKERFSIKCIPEFGGKFSINAFVWESEDNPTALSPPISKEILVEGKPLPKTELSEKVTESTKIQKDKNMKKSSKEQNIVFIPMGSSVPGCEKTGKCFIPSILEITLGSTVTWKNQDTAAHTVTSGTPDSGPDGYFDSSMVLSDCKFSFRFNQKGEYSYFDMVHPWQVGTIIVS
jgi:plastocyanin